MTTLTNTSIEHKRILAPSEMCGENGSTCEAFRQMKGVTHRMSRRDETKEGIKPAEGREVAVGLVETHPVLPRSRRKRGRPVHPVASDKMKFPAI